MENSGNVYVMKCGDNKYKIGVSVDIDDRRNCLQTGNPDLITIYKRFDCKLPFEMEKSVLIEFKKYQAIGEWFIIDETEIERFEYSVHKIWEKTNEKLYECEICDYGTKFLQNFERHLNTKKHNINNNINNNINDTTDNIKTNIVNIKSTCAGVFKCDRCSKIFNRAYHLNRHLRKKKPCKYTNIHEDTQTSTNSEDDSKTNEKKSYVCMHCEKNFASNSSMNRHIRLFCKKKKEMDDYKNLYEIIEQMQQQFFTKEKEMERKIANLENNPQNVTIQNVSIE